MRALVLVALVTAPAAADDAPSYRRYVTTANGTSLDTLEWEGSEDFAGKPTPYVQSVRTVGDAIQHAREYHELKRDGLYFVGGRSDFEAKASLSVTDLDADPAYVVLPKPFRPGAKRSYKTTLTTSTTIDGKPTKAQLTAEATTEVTGKQSVTVPAGTFACLAVRTVVTTTIAYGEGPLAGATSTIKSSSVSWYAPKIGRVKQEVTSDTELQSGGTKQTTHESSVMSLVEYRATVPSQQMKAIGFLTLR